MTDLELMTRFFSAWGQADPAERQTTLTACMTPDATYADPHCPGPMRGVDAVANMLSAFSENMPGATARPLGTPSSHNGFLRTTVSFENNGAEMMRGQYFAQRDGDKLCQVIGFVGMGDDA